MMIASVSRVDTAPPLEHGTVATNLTARQAPVAEPARRWKRPPIRSRVRPLHHQQDEHAGTGRRLCHF